MEANQHATHGTLHQIIEQLNAVTFNASKAGLGCVYYGCGCSRGCARRPGCGPPMFAMGGLPQGGGIPPNGGFPPKSHLPGFFLTGPPPGVFQGNPASIPQAFCAPPTMPAQGFAIPNSFAGPPTQASVQQLPYLNVVKRFSNWNACYSCGFDVADGHNSMLCPAHLCKVMHMIYHNHQNAQQYINLGHPCSTRNRHKTQLPTM
jgi:hypothetical protein